MLQRFMKDGGPPGQGGHYGIHNAASPVGQRPGYPVQNNYYGGAPVQAEPRQQYEYGGSHVPAHQTYHQSNYNNMMSPQF